MYRINIDDIDSLKSFLIINDTEYIDAIIDLNKATLVTNTKEIFAALTLDSIAIDEESSLMIRINRKLLLGLANTGHILIKIVDSFVKMDFFVITDTGDSENSVSENQSLLYNR